MSHFFLSSSESILLCTAAIVVTEKSVFTAGVPTPALAQVRRAWRHVPSALPIHNLAPLKP